MNDLISRQMAIAYLTRKANMIGCYGLISTKEIYDYLSELPSAEPERKTGSWIKDGHHIQCNQCGISICDKDREGDVLPKKFCPNCGADMRGEQSEIN